MSLDDYKLEERLRTHLRQQADAIHFEETFEPHRGDRPGRSGLSLVAAAAVIIVAGLGFAAVTGIFERSNITEVATVPDTEADPGEVSDQDSEPVGNEEQRVDDVGAPATSFNVIDITHDSMPSFHPGYRVDDGVYIVLSTAPGRVGQPLSNSFEDLETYNEQFIPRTFYTLDTSSAEQGEGSDYIWQHATVEERYISGFEVNDGLLYAVSTGLTTGERAPAIGTSPDHGVSWNWNDAPELSEAAVLAIDRSGDQLVIAGFRPSAIDPVDAIGLALQGGLEIDRNDFALGTYNFVEYFSPSVNAASGNLDTVRVRWADLGVTPPESWRPWVGLYRYNGDGTVTELTIGDADQTSHFWALNNYPDGPDYDISFERWSDANDSRATLELTESLTWNSISSPYLNVSGSVGPYRFAADDQSETLPQLLRFSEDNTMTTLTAEDLVPGEGIVTGEGLTVHNSKYGLFVDFNAYGDMSQLVATPNGDDWQVIDAEFDGFLTLDGDNEVLLIGTSWHEIGDGSTRQEGHAYRLTPGGS